MGGIAAPEVHGNLRVVCENGESLRRSGRSKSTATGCNSGNVGRWTAGESVHRPALLDKMPGKVISNDAAGTGDQ